MTKAEYMQFPETYVPAEIRRLVQEDFKNKYINTDWQLLEDGTNIHQESGKYKYLVRRYE